MRVRLKVAYRIRDLAEVELEQFNLSEIHPIWGVETLILDPIFPLA
jgi:hypothetical protein